MMSISAPNPYASPQAPYLQAAALAAEQAGVHREGEDCFVEFEFTRDDMVRFGQSLAVAQQLRLLQVILMVLAATAWLSSVVRNLRQLPLPQALVWTGVVTTVWLVVAAMVWFIVRPLLYWLTGLLLQYQLRRGTNQGMLGPRRFTISPAGITEAMTLRVWQLRWQAIERIEASPHGLYLFDSALSALIVPRHAFRSEEEFQGFVDDARRFHAAAE